MRLRTVLADVARHLSADGFRFALVGGLAVSVRGEPRFTRDVDIVVHVTQDAEAERCVFELRNRGFTVLATVEQAATRRLATARLVHPSQIVCDLIFATTGIEHEIVDAADPIEIFPGETLPTASAEALLAMKTLSVTSQRPKDLVDIYSIVRAHTALDEARVLTLLALIEKRGCARGQTLVPKWTDIYADIRGLDKDVNE